MSTRIAALAWWLLAGAVAAQPADIADSALPPSVEAQPLGQIDPDAAGLLSTDVTGLPADLWAGSSAADLVALFGAQPRIGLPAIQAFTQQLALAELDPPAGGDGAAFLGARIDMLMARGALDPALALIERAGTDRPELFARWFDLALLIGDAGPACRALRSFPGLAPSIQARVFCLIRAGDWPAATATLTTAEALGAISPEAAEITARFLAPELYEDAGPVPAPQDIDPLSFTMLGAIGERPAVGDLPPAFAFADLNGSAGWQAQITAAERLARSGAIGAGQWRAVMTERVPSASGQPWDRVAALQALERALAGDGDVAAALPPAWRAVRSADLAVPFAQIYAQPLLDADLQGSVRALALRIALLTDLYEVAAADPAADPDLAAVARGEAPRVASDPLTAAVARAFADPRLAPSDRAYLDQRRLGEALLRASLAIGRGTPDPGDLEAGLSLFLSVGLFDLARRTALQTLILRPT